MIKDTVYVAVAPNKEYYYTDGVLDYLFTTSDAKYADYYNSKEEIKNKIGGEYSNGVKFEPIAIETIEIKYDMLFRELL